MTRRRELAACATLVLVSLVVGLILLELACRVGKGVQRLLREPDLAVDTISWVIHDPLLGFVPRPNAVAPEGTSDRDGFRVVPGDAAAGTALIVATGDSFTFGQEVADHEAWPAILQELMGVRVVNAGMGAFGIDQTVLRTERLAAALGPTTIVMSFIADDIWRAELRRLWGKEKPYFVLGSDGELVLHNVPVPTGPPLPDASDLASPLQRLVGSSVVIEIATRLLATYGNWSHWRMERFDDTVRALPAGAGEKVACALMHRLAHARAPILVVAQYDLESWSRGPVHQAEQRRLSRGVLGCASTAGLATLDTFEALEEAISRGGLRLLYLQDHHSALGNRLVARSIGDALTAGGMLELPARRRQNSIE